MVIICALAINGTSISTTCVKGTSIYTRPVSKGHLYIRDLCQWRLQQKHQTPFIDHRCKATFLLGSTNCYSGISKFAVQTSTCLDHQKGFSICYISCVSTWLHHKAVYTYRIYLVFMFQAMECILVGHDMYIVSFPVLPDNPLPWDMKM